MNVSPLRHAGPEGAGPRTHNATHHTPRRTGRAALALAGVMAFVLLGAAACGKKGDPQATPTADTILTGSPSVAASVAPSSSAAASPQASQTSSGGQTVTFPSSAKEYGLATLAAFASGSKAKLDLFAVQAAVAQFGGHGKPNSQWTNLSCEAAGADHTACDYRNAHGDDARLTMLKTQLGHPTATTDVFLNKTQYSMDAAGYVSDFMAAWGDGNKQRMTRYASASIASSFTGKTPPTGSQTNAGQNGKTWTVTVTGLPLGSGNWTFTVNGDKLGGGNAITAAKFD